MKIHQTPEFSVTIKRIVPYKSDGTIDETTSYYQNGLDKTDASLVVYVLARKQFFLNLMYEDDKRKLSK